MNRECGPECGSCGAVVSMIASVLDNPLMGAGTA